MQFFSSLLAKETKPTSCMRGIGRAWFRCTRSVKRTNTPSSECKRHAHWSKLIFLITRDAVPAFATVDRLPNMIRDILGPLVVILGGKIISWASCLVEHVESIRVF